MIPPAISHFLAALLIMVCTTIPGARGQCGVRQVNFQAGETLEYNVYYNWGFIWIEGGEVIFRVENGGKEQLKISGEGKTYPSRDWIFKIRDQYISIVDEQTLVPIYASRSNQEGSFWCDYKYFFDNKLKHVVAETREVHKNFARDTLRLDGCYIDLMTAVCMVRCYDFSRLKPNERISFPALMANEVLPLDFRYLGKVTLTIHEQGLTYRCHKLKVNLVAGSMFNEGENMTVWVTDDGNQIPVQFEAQILVGNVKAIVRSVDGLKYPVTSVVGKHN